MKWFSFIQLMVVVILSGCVNLNKGPQIDQYQVQEALIRHILNTGFDALDKTEHLFISIDGTDPVKELIERVADIRPRIYPVSDSKLSPDTGLVMHRVKSGSAAIIQIRSMTAFNRKKVKIDWGHYKANLNASGSTATLKFKNGNWRVTKNRMKWMS